MYPFKAGREAPLSWLQLALVLMLYFGLYLTLGSYILSTITLLFHGDEKLFMIIQAVYYLIMSGLIYALIHPVFTESDVFYMENRKDNFLYAFKTIGRMFLFMLAMNTLLNLITGQETSDNQGNVNSLLFSYPYIMIPFSTLLAPWCEEMVFRGTVYRKLRERSFLLANTVSALLFGFVHVSAAFQSGNLKDLAYIIVYAGLGMFLNDAYEKSGSLYTAISIHMFINLFSVVVNILSIL